MNGQFNLGDVSPIHYFLVVASALGLLFALIVPSEPAGPPWLVVVLQWQFQTLMPIFLILMTSSLLPDVRGFGSLPQWMQLGLCGLIGAMLFSPLGLWFDVQILNESLVLPFWQELIDEMLAIVPPVTIAWIVINLPFLLGFALLKQNTDTKSQKTQSEAPTCADAKFMQLVPESIQGIPIYLKSELHYLQVVTTCGQTLVLYNLRDAVHELEHFPGLRPHRSYWVNRDFIQTLKKTGRQGTLLLTTGQSIPVSRQNFASIQTEF